MATAMESAESDNRAKYNVAEVDARMVAGIPATITPPGMVLLVHSLVVSEDGVDSVDEDVVAAGVDVAGVVEERTTTPIKLRVKRSILLVKKAKQEKALKMAKPAFRYRTTF